MKKNLFLIGFFTLISLTTLYSQHTVGDVREHGGWYSVRFEFNRDGSSTVFVTQKYPSGETYEVIGDEREKLPLYLKFFALGLLEELEGSFDFDVMTFSENGFLMQVTNFSVAFTFLFCFTMPEEEILYELESEMLERFRHLRWP